MNMEHAQGSWTILRPQDFGDIVQKREFEPEKNAKAEVIGSFSPLKEFPRGALICLFYYSLLVAY